MQTVNGTQGTVTKPMNRVTTSMERKQGHRHPCRLPLRARHGVIRPVPVSKARLWAKAVKGALIHASSHPA